MTDPRRPEKSTNVRLVRALFAILQRRWPAAAPRAALWLFGRPQRHRRPEREGLLLRSARPFTLGLGASRLEGWSWGEGPTVLLVHGWAGRGAQLGALVPPLVEAGFRVVAYDGPAHGASPGRATTLVGQAGALDRVLAALGPVHAIVAHSLGAAAATIALSRGHLVARVAYVAPMSRVQGALDRFGRFVGLTPGTARSFRDAIEAATGVAIGEIEGASLARRLAQPLLIVHDVDDDVVPVGDAEALAASWRGARLRRVSSLGHRRILRDEGVVEEIVRFVAACRPRPVSFAEQLSRELERPEARPPLVARLGARVVQGA